jgi:hypothetical protein
MPGIKMCAIVTRGAILFTLFSVSSEIVGLTASAEKQASAKRFAKIEILKTGNDLRETCNGFRELPDIPGSDIPCRNFIRGIYETIVVTDGVTATLTMAVLRSTSPASQTLRRTPITSRSAERPKAFAAALTPLDLWFSLPNCFSSFISSRLTAARMFMSPPQKSYLKRKSQG